MRAHRKALNCCWRAFSFGAMFPVPRNDSELCPFWWKKTRIIIIIINIVFLTSRFSEKKRSHEIYHPNPNTNQIPSSNPNLNSNNINIQQENKGISTKAEDNNYINIKNQYIQQQNQKPLHNSNSHKSLNNK